MALEESNDEYKLSTHHVYATKLHDPMTPQCIILTIFVITGMQYDSPSNFQSSTKCPPRRPRHQTSQHSPSAKSNPHVLQITIDLISRPSPKRRHPALCDRRRRCEWDTAHACTQRRGKRSRRWLRDHYDDHVLKIYTLDVVVVCFTY
jgi:hypothetical protein